MLFFKIIFTFNITGTHIDIKPGELLQKHYPVYTKGGIID